MFGELVPVGGGDTVPLLKSELKIGRRESNDIVLRFPNVSGEHCSLTMQNGYWFVTDLESRNGVKVNGSRVTRKRLDPGDELAVGKHVYEMRYSPSENGAVGGPPADEDHVQQIMGSSLLQRAGLQRRAGDSPVKRGFDINDDGAGKMKPRDVNE